MAHDVFISYSTEDKATADAVCAALEASHIRCWVAPRDVLPGQNYAQQLIRAIHGADVMVLVFSSKSNRSGHVMREIERAATRDMPILPFRIEDVPPSEAMEYYISSTHWLDALTPPLEKHLEHLANTVQRLLDRTGRAALAAQEKAKAEAEARAEADAEARAAALDKARAEARAEAEAEAAAKARAKAEAVGAAAAGATEEAPTKAAAKTGADAKAAVDAAAKAARLEHAVPTARPWYRRPWVLSALGAVAVAVVAGIVLFTVLTGGEKDGTTDNLTSTSVAAYTTDAPGTTTTAASTTPVPELLWKFQTQAGQDWSSPAVLDGMVYFCSGNQYLCALRSTSGEEKWRFFPTVDDTWSPRRSPPAVSEDAVYFDCNDGLLYAVDRMTGQQRWTFEKNNMDGRGPIFSDGVVYFCAYTDNNAAYVYALDSSTGKQIWKFETNGDVSLPVVSDGMVYFGTGEDGRIYALDGRSGQVKWTFQSDWAVSAPAASEGTVCFGSVEGHIYALDGTSGVEEWKIEMGGDVVSYSPTISGGTVYLGGSGEGCMALDASGGNVKWTAPWTASFRPTSSPIVSDGMFYCTTYSAVFALDSRSGQKMWRFDTPSSIVSSPAVSDGVAYFGSADGYLYAVK